MAGFLYAASCTVGLCEAVKAWDALIGTLTEKQKEQFEVYMSARREVNVL